MHINGALNVEYKPDEIIEVILHDDCLCLYPCSTEWNVSGQRFLYRTKADGADAMLSYTGSHPATGLVT
jgi:hypothetical protein